MNRTPLLVSLLLSLLVVALLGGLLATGTTPQLGLDLRGGISAIYTPVLDEGEQVDDEEFDVVLDETIEIIRNRVDALGVAEPEISRQGDDILVQLPGLEDAARAQEVIGATAQLTFRRVEAIVTPAELEEAGQDVPDCSGEVEDLSESEGGVLCAAELTEGVDGEEFFTLYRVGPAEITGDGIEEAFATIGNSGWEVALEFQADASGQFQQITADLACDRDAGRLGLFAIVLDGRVESAPGVNPGVACGQGIVGGAASITVGGQGQADDGEAEAQDLALVLRTGALPITLEPSTFQTVSATLGAQSLDAGLLAAGIGLLFVALYLIFFYRTLGVISVLALGVFGVLVTGMLGLLGRAGFALTLAGIAGIVVSIGITADSSILFFERIRDEVRLGKTVRTAVQRAYTSAFRTNLAGNTVTLAAAVILYFLAAGSVRGFALTLGLATILDIAILAAFTRPMVFLLSNTRLMPRSSLRVGAAPRRQPRRGRGSGAADAGSTEEVAK